MTGCVTQYKTTGKALQLVGLLWYGHKSMPGRDDVEDEFFEGTAKSMEGLLTSE